MQHHIVALSGGKDSTAMALALAEFEPRDYLFVCTPTGDELPEMKAHMTRLEALLGQSIHTMTDRSLESEIAKQGMLPNHRARWCTRRIKIEPFIQFLDQHKPAVSYVGLRADELGREGNSYGGEVNVLTDGTEVPDVEHRFPLQEWGWGLEEVWDYLNQRGITIPWRTDCSRCFFQRIGEWYVLWRDYPNHFRDAANQEHQIGHTYRGPKIDKTTKQPVYEDRYGIGPYVVAARDTWPAWLSRLGEAFEQGHKPKESHSQFNLFEDPNRASCRVCTL